MQELSDLELQRNPGYDIMDSFNRIERLVSGANEHGHLKERVLVGGPS